MFLLAHAAFAFAPAAAAAAWWQENRGFREGAPDLRWLLAGTLLPDIVDKTLGQILFRSYFQNGRIYFHAFIPTLFFLVVGFYGWNRRLDHRLLFLACGMLSHLVLDRIWTEPTTAFWPSLGPFLRHPSTQSILEQILEYARDPLFWVGESAGATVLVASFRYMGINSMKKLADFLRRGTLPGLLSPGA